jgi:hypothetical protein
MPLVGLRACRFWPPLATIRLLHWLPSAAACAVSPAQMVSRPSGASPAALFWPPDEIDLSAANQAKSAEHRGRS